ncbi:MAG TPA: hypothetical protein VGR52_08920 [Stellaceae bacterium]|nr:hypothetical protein [Stellaceae bacterium]
MGSTELEAARSRAQTLFGKGNKQEKGKDEEFFRARDEERQKEAAKMARLRALRLEKEAKEKEEKDGADKKAAASVTRRKPAL